MPTFDVSYDFSNNYGGTPANAWNHQSKKSFRRIGTTRVTTSSSVATDTGMKASPTPCLKNTAALRATLTDLTGKYDLYSVDVAVKALIVETVKNKGAIARISGGLGWRIVDSNGRRIQNSYGVTPGNRKTQGPVKTVVSKTYSMFIKKGVSTFIGGCHTVGGLQVSAGGTKDFEAFVSVAVDISLTLDVKDVWIRNKDGSYSWVECKTAKVTKAKRGKTISLPSEEQGFLDHFGELKAIRGNLLIPNALTSINTR